jgi:hypothetical protein
MEGRDMKFDSYGCLVTERWPEGEVGNLGDSQAESSRLACLCMYVGIPNETASLKKFRTEIGYLRHPSPDLPMDWRESDSTTDQVICWYLACLRAHPELATEMKDRLKKWGWRTGNGDFVSPLFWAVLNNKKLWWVKTCLWTQAQLFKIPWRWNDEKKWFERNEDSSSDYLNWFIVAMFIPGASKYIPLETLWSKIQHYYKPEPNCEWFLDIYKRALNRFYAET